MTRKDGRIRRMVLTLGVVLAALVGAVAFAPAAQAQEVPFSTPFFNEALRGDVAVVGNTLVQCATLPEGPGTHTPPTPAHSANCQLSRTNFPPAPVPWCTVQPSAGANGDCPGAQNDADSGVRRIDVDGPGGMTNGSRATLSLPPGATVRAAYLYWAGVSNDQPLVPQGANPDLPAVVSVPPPNPALINRATLDPPAGGPTTVFGEPGRRASLAQGNRDFYLEGADVTALVQAGGAGVYQLGNTQLGEGQNRSGGWSLYVVYNDPNTTLKQVSLYDGFQFVSGACPGNGCVTFNVSGFLTPPTGPVRTSISIQGQDGDYHLAPNRLNVDGQDLSNALNQSFNIMNSTITNAGVHVPGRDPQQLQTNGWDLDVFDETNLLANGQQSTAIIFGTDGQEPATLEVLTFVTDLFEPRITNTKTATDVNGGLLIPGEEIEYVITTSNAAGAEVDGATNFVLTDSIPANTTVVGGSVTVDGNPGCSFAANVISCALGTMNQGDSHTIRFRVVVNAGVPIGTVISNTCNTEYDTVTLPNANLSTPCPVANITVTGPPQDLTIDKRHTGNFTTGTPGTFQIEVSNAGALPSSGAIRVTDPIPGGLTLVSATGTNWNCAASTASFMDCTTNDVAAPNGGALPVITLTVSVDPFAPASITNTATVEGGGDTNAANNSDSDQVTVVSAFDVGVTKVVNTPTAFPGDAVTFTIFVSNAGPGATGVVTLQDTLPAGLTATQLSTNFGTCDLGTLTCSFPFLSPPPSNTATVTLVATVNAGTDNTTQTNTVQITPGAGDTNGNNHQSSASVAIQGRPDMTIQKTHAPEPFVRGATGSFQLTARNSGTASTGGAVTVTDAMPAGLSATSASGSGWDCNASTAANISCTRSDALGTAGNYPPITVNVNIAFNAATQLTNTGVVAGGGEVNNTNNTDDDVVNLVDQFDVAVFKSVPNPADLELLPGEQGTFRITVQNNGPSGTAAFALDEQLPAGLILVSAANPGGGASCNASVDCTIGPMAPGAQVLLDIVVQAPMIVLGATETNVVSIAPGPNDTNPNNHTAQATIRILPVSRMTGTKTLTSPLVRGATGRYSFIARNTGGAPTVNPVTVLDPMPAGLTLASASGPGWDCTASTAAQMSCTRSDPLGPGAEYPPITIVVNVSLTAPATIENVVSMPCNQPPPCFEIPPPPRRDDPIDQIDLSIEKTVSPTPNVRAGSDVTWTLTIRNAGPSNANGVSVDDTLPAGMAFVSAAASDGGTCVGPDCSWSAPVGPGATRTVTIVSTASIAPAVADTDQVNTATVTSANIASDTQRTNETDTATVHIISPDLEMEKVSTSRLVRGADATFDLTVTNIGTAFAQGPITVTDTLPVGLTFVSAVGAGWTCSNVLQVTTCTRPGNIPAGQGVPVITITARVALDAPATLANTACVGQPPGQPDSDPANNCKTIPQKDVFSEVDLQIDKTAAPDSILATQETTYTIVITNNGPSIAEDVESLDLIPAGFIPVSAATTLGTCTAPEYTCTLGDMQPQQVETITIVAEAENAKPPAETIVTNVAEVSSSTTELDNTNNTDTADVEVRRTNDLLTVKTRVTDPPIAGAAATFEILVTNLGPSDALDTTISDPIPAPFEAGTVTTAFVRGVGTCGVSLTGTTLNCDVPSILAGEDVLISVTGKLKSDTFGQDLFNIACAENIGDPETGNNCDETEKKKIEERADVEVVKEGPATVQADAEITYSLVVRNNGPSDAREVTAADTIPEGTTLVDVDPDCPFDEATRTVTCTIGLMKPAEERTFSITVDTKLDQADKELTNTVVCASLTPEPDPTGTCTDDHKTKVDPASDLAVIKDGPLTVFAEQDLKYTMTITNKGPSPSPNTVMTDKLPGELAFLSATTPQGTCSHSNGTVSCNLGTLEKDQTVVVEVLVRPAKSLQNLTVKNTASVEGPNFDPVLENNKDDHDVLVKPPLPDLRVSKTLKSGTPRVGERITYEIVAQNVGNGPATNVVITDTLPAGLVFISVDPSSGSCSGRQMLTCQVGNLAPGARATVTLVVSVKTRGDHVNVADAKSDEPDLNPLDNRAELRSSATAMIDPVIRKSSTARSVRRGESIPYTITFRNPGPGTLRGVRICDNPPSGLTYVPGSARPRASLRNGQVCWTIKSLAAGRSKTFRLRARADLDARGTRLRNTVTASGPGMLTKRARKSVPLTGAVRGQRVGGVTG